MSAASTTSTTPTTPTSRGRTGGGGRRLLALVRANVLLMTRNRLTLIYATVLPLLPMAFLFTAKGDTDAGITAAGPVLLLALLFPVYYNVLSLFVTRRDELVLKRLRTGETRDQEQLVSLALPGCVIALAVMAVAVGVGAALDMPLPANPLLYAVTGVLGCAIFAALAFVTASFTRTAEAAQITSMPVILVASIGAMTAVLPDRFADVVEWTPMAAVDTMLRISWFGQLDGGSLSFGATWSEAAQPLLILLAWAFVALDLARRYLRWEPRA